MRAGVSRERHSRSSDSESAQSGNRTQLLRPSGLVTDTQPDTPSGGKRPQRSTKKEQRDNAGRLRSRMSGSEREEATTKQLTKKQAVTDEIDTDTDFF